MAATLVVVPIVALGAQQTQQISWIVGGLRGLAGLPDGLLGSTGVAVIIAVLAVIGLVHGRWPVVLLAVWAVFPMIFTYLAFDIVKLFLPRYLLFTLPALAILASAGAIALSRRARARRTEWSVAAGSVVLLLLLLVAGWQEHRRIRGDLVAPAPLATADRDAARYVARRLRPGDGVVYEGYSRLRRAMAYEWRRQPAPRDLLLSVTPEARGSFDARECRPAAPCLDAAPRIWLMLLGDDAASLGDVPGEKGEALRARYREVGSESFGRLQVVELILAPETPSPSGSLPSPVAP